MAVLSTQWPTMLDVSRRTDPTGKIASIAELLNQSNPILDDMPLVEGNATTGHRTTTRTGIPEATWRKLNQGVQPTKSTTTQITDVIGNLEAYSEIDKNLANLNGNTAEWRLSEDLPFLEGMNQTMAHTLFYGDTTVNPERFMGLSPRYSQIDRGPDNALNILSAGGTKNQNTSIWLIYWGAQTVHGIYPKGSTAGLNHADLGEQTLLDSAQGRYQGYRTHYKWDLGLSVRDWRYIVRIANIDYKDLQSVSDKNDTSANLLKLMSQAIGLIPNQGIGRPAFYCNRFVQSLLRVKLQSAKNVYLTLDDYMGKPKVLQFEGIPVRPVSEFSLTNTEANVI